MTILQLLVYIARSSKFCGIKSQLPILFIYLRQKLLSIISPIFVFSFSPPLFLFFCLCFMLKFPGWWKALISVLFYSSFIYTHTHTHSHYEFHLPLSIHYSFFLSSVCVYVSWTNSSHYLNLVFNLSSLHCSHLLTFTPSVIFNFISPLSSDHNLLPWSWVSSSYLFSFTPLPSIFIIHPPTLLTFYAPWSNKITHRHAVDTVLSRHYHIRSTVMQLVYSNCNLTYSVITQIST